MSDQDFSHMSADGSITMVDVGHKNDTRRVAIVRTVVEVSPNTLDLLKRQALPKGDVLTTAKVAGILAAKRTWELIPLCHPLVLSYVDVRFSIQDETCQIHIEAEARTTGQTGVEMEALVAAQTAAMTIYDMCKAVQKDIVIRDCRLVYKAGGKSGEFRAE
ncbi:MAG: cyclic pyranopterin monophosphate synthase MoaC [Halodesulfovibrio sp.]